MDIVYSFKEMGEKIKEYRAKGCNKYNFLNPDFMKLPSTYIDILAKGVILDYDEEKQQLNFKYNESSIIYEQTRINKTV